MINYIELLLNIVDLSLRCDEYFLCNFSDWCLNNIEEYINDEGELNDRELILEGLRQVTSNHISNATYQVYSKCLHGYCWDIVDDVVETYSRS